MRLNMHCLSHRGLFLFGLLLTSVPPAGAVTLEDLLHAGRLKIKTWTEPASPVIARQQLMLHIEVATDRWFSGGTRVGPVEVQDAIVLQRETFAVNSTRREENQTWVVQQWSISIYPLRDGDFVIPAIPIHLSIAGKDANTSITGSLHTAPLSFTAMIPDALRKTDGHWVVTTRFEVTEQYNRSLDGLNPGDALIRTIRVSADNLPAMMLPAIKPETIPGVSVYPKPPQLVDRVNRGEYLAQRKEVFTYVFEKPGTYHLPARTFFWWNRESGSLESEQLEAQTLHVGGISGGSDGSLATGKQSENPAMSWISMAAWALALFAVAWVLWWIFGKYIQRHPSQQPVPPSESKLRKQFEQACRQNDAKAAVRFLYQWLDAYGGASFRASVRRSFHDSDQRRLLATFEEVMRLLYGSARQGQVDLMRFAGQFIQQHKKYSRFSPDRWWKVRLTLN